MADQISIYIDMIIKNMELCPKKLMSLVIQLDHTKIRNRIDLKLEFYK